MIVWGGTDDHSFFNTGGRYNPGTDSWTATSTTNAPAGRTQHTTVWTGSEMIVWGGAVSNSDVTNTGGRYNPITDSWIATSTANAPEARQFHTAVWTDSEMIMIVWGGGGNAGLLNTGGRYNPITDSWIATSTANAAEARQFHTAVWTESEMTVWGGFDNVVGFSNTGGIYNPITDSWTATSTTNAPSARWTLTAVWTGSEMIVWGGLGNPYPTYFNTGGRYNPSTDSWTATSTTNAPTGRDAHAAVWSGNEMIVWGGISGNFLNTGGRYDPGMNSWTATSTTNAPSGRAGPTAVWTESEMKMIVWGGAIGGGSGLNTGGRYCAAGPSPTPTPTPSPTPTATATPPPTATPRVTPRPRPTPHPRP
jgi:hypothetical protein